MEVPLHCKVYTKLNLILFCIVYFSLVERTGTQDFLTLLEFLVILLLKINNNIITLICNVLDDLKFHNTNYLPHGNFKRSTSSWFCSDDKAAFLPDWTDGTIDQSSSTPVSTPVSGCEAVHGHYKGSQQKLMLHGKHLNIIWKTIHISITNSYQSLVQEMDQLGL